MVGTGGSVASGGGPRSWVGTGSLFPLLFLVLSISACGDSPSGVQGGAGDRFPAAAAQGLNAGALAAAYDEADTFVGIQSLLVQRHGVLVAEHYFNGFSPDSLHDVRSVTKSVISILIGIALDRGVLQNVDQTLGELLPELTAELSAAKKAISVRHLLMMSSGLDWHELDLGSSYSDWWAAEDMLQFVLDLPFVHESGERFIYNTGASHLLSVILSEASGQTTLEFAREHLFTPLGITDVDWLLLPDGYYAGGMGLRIDARTMVRLGQMVLDRGMFDGRRIVSDAWVTQSTSTHLATGGVMAFGQEYGYLWWVGHTGGRDYYFANGYGGQFIVVVPDLDLVVTASAGWRGLGWIAAAEQWYPILDLIVNRVLPTATP